MQASLFGASTFSEKKKAREGTFADNMTLPVHRWFRYSAGFSAEWVEQVMQTYQPNSVLDPFAGSGTTNVSSLFMGVNSIGMENHPFINRIAKIKTSKELLPDEVNELADSILNDVATNEDLQISLDGISSLLLKCYDCETLKILLLMRDSWHRHQGSYSSSSTEFIWLVITSILRPCSNVGTAQWQYILPNKRKAKVLNPVEAFTHKLRLMISDFVELDAKSKDCDCIILREDSRCHSPNIAEGSIDLVITSPPYPNNFDYADSTRLEMTFWGEISGWGDLQSKVRKHIMRSCSQHAAAERLRLQPLLDDDLLEPIRDEISYVCGQLDEIRHSKGGKKSYHLMVAAYFLDISKVFKSLRYYCTSSSSLCFVIGDSAPYGIYVPVDKWIHDIAVHHGFVDSSFEKIRDRNIKWKNRKHRVPLKEGRLWIQG